MSRAAKTAPSMVCSVDWLSGRPAACCMAATDSTTAAGLSTMTEGSISGADKRMRRSAGDCGVS
eukprot:11826107-Alexandrium_andersonii.AAC.1